MTKSPARAPVIARLLSAKSAVVARTWISRGTDLLFPPACTFCRGEIESSAAGLLCQECRAALVDGRRACSRCGAGLPELAVACPRCQHERLHFTGVVRLGRYEHALRTAVLRMKHQRERALAIAVGELTAEVRGGDCAAWRADVLVPVPMHWTRKIVRGANSPEILCESLGRRLRLPVAADLLVRRRRTSPQASLSPNQRLSNVRGAFRARSHRDLIGARALLVDDIMTTGATVNEAAKTLLAAGASLVGVVVLARAE